MIMTPFNEFLYIYKLKIEAISNIKYYQALSSIGLDKFVFLLGDGSFEIDKRIVNLHPTKETHWVAYIY